MLPVRVPVRTPGVSRRKRRDFNAASRKSIESLEERLYWTVSQDTNGWTTVTEPAGSKVIYVSSSTGSDLNPGTINAPVASLAEAQKLSSSGPNEILLKSGDTFTESTSNGWSNWNLSGQSAANPFVISYYGTGARPMIYAGNAGTAFYINSGVNVNYLDILGIQFDANYRDPTLGTVNETQAIGEVKGIEIQGTGGNILIEDCSVNCFGNNGGDNLDIEGNAGSLSNVTLRRDTVTNAWTLYYNSSGGVTSPSQQKCEGMYCFNVSNVSVLQCTFDHNGWDTACPGSVDTGYSHDMYFGPTCTGIVVQQSVIAEAAFAGIMDRAGGNIDYNMFIDNAVACSFGDADGGIMSTPGGVSGSLIGNVIDIDKAEGSVSGSPLAYGQGFVIANTAPSADVMVEDNLFIGDTQNAKPAITLTMATGTSNPAQCVGLNNLTIANNVIDGWRWGIDIDGRFVPGATGLYALNGLVISHNDFDNSTVSLVRQDGAFAASAESWTGNRYIDTLGLPQSNWILLQSKSFSFTTWATTYDIGATALFTFPYSDPTRTAATYDTTQSGPGTWQDFLLQSDQLSIYDYRPQYMAQAAITYIDAGFNITSNGTTIGGGGGSGGGGSAFAGVVMGTAATTDVNTSSLGTTTYTFTVNYLDPFVLNSGKLGNSNIMVTGPNGFYELATFVSAATPYIDSNNYQHTVATYRITAPSGAWGAGQNGTYSVTLLPGQALDSSGAFAQSGVIGTFIVDLTNPVAMVSNLGSPSSGTTSTSFTISYFDAYGIDITTLNSFEVQVTGPSGFSQYATLVSDTITSNSQTAVGTYSLAGPAGGWTAAANGTYTVSMLAGGVADLGGNTVAAGVLGTFPVAIGVNASSGTASISGTVFNDAERQVEQEDPVPAGVGGDEASQRRAEHERRETWPGDVSDGLGELVFGRGAQNDEAADGDHHSSADALQDSQ